MANRIIRYIYHDPFATSEYWQGYEETFDNTVISEADKYAEEYDKRTMITGERNENFIKFIQIVDP